MIRDPQRQGFAPILVAVGILALLATLRVMTAFSSGFVHRRQQEMTNRLEAFYSSELSAWHAHRRGLDALATSSVEFDNTPYSNLTLPEEPNSDVPGMPHNVTTTLRSAPSQSLARRYASGRVQANIQPNGVCGTSGFSSTKRYRVCLQSHQSSSPVWLIGMGGASNSSPDPNAPSGSSYQLHFWELDQEGRGLSTFGSSGHFTARIVGPAQDARVSYFKVSPFPSLYGWTENNFLAFHTGIGLWRFSSIDGHPMGTSGMGATGMESGRFIYSPNGATTQFAPAILPYDGKPIIPFGLSLHSMGSGTSVSWAQMSGADNSALSMTGSYDHPDFIDTILDWKIVGTRLKILASSLELSATPRTTFLILQFTLESGYFSNNRLDSAFGSSGIVQFDCEGAGCNVKTAKFMSDGKIRLATANNELRVYQFTPDGSLDLAWGTSGFTRLLQSASSYAVTIAFMPDETFYVLRFQGGNNTGLPREVWLDRYKPDGTIDNSFASGGQRQIMATQLGPGDLSPLIASDVLVAQDQSIIAVFHDNFTSLTSFLYGTPALNDLNCPAIGVVRLNSSGGFVESFGNGKKYGYPGRSFLCAPPNNDMIPSLSWTLAE
ncbi:MAG: hypothetical protein HYR96_01680 [Deltaproteobacteria bacterium]|nr:hypothetical protein [Deltaproteobacteria bacterium]MBI3295991.1 hypothetical protein [Deltaproteobacteria bacterium]